MWYYTENGQPFGPFDAGVIRARVADGTLAPTTFVWREGLANWAPFEEVAELNVSTTSPNASPLSMPTPELEASPYAPRVMEIEQFTTRSAPTITAADPSNPHYVCCECGKIHSVNIMVFLEGRWACANCKPTFLQKLEERFYDRKGLSYAAFSTRFHSGFYDYIILGILSFALYFLLSIPLFSVVAVFHGDVTMTIILIVIVCLLLLLVRPLYEAISIAANGATLGQKCWGLMVVNRDGSRLNLKRSFLRTLANIISNLTLGLGYTITLFDEEKRSLTDIMCGTHVIYIRK